MGKDSKIEWCDHTWNPWFGCAEVSPACQHCYARVMMDERYGKVTWGAGEDRMRTSAANWREPFKWDRAAKDAGKIATVFCLSLGDFWDNEVNPIWRREAKVVMEATPNLLYLILSKRIGNAVKMCDPMSGNSPLPLNCAFGATMINQEEWDRDMPKLKEAARVLGPRFTFASVEPMLGPITMRGLLPDWVIVGGESGKNARPMHPQWVRNIRDQCKAASVAFLFKQWGGWRPVAEDRTKEPWFDTAKGHNQKTPAFFVAIDGTVHCFTTADEEEQQHRIVMLNVGKKAAGRLLDGAEHNGYPDIGT